MPTIVNDHKRRFQASKERVQKHRDLVDSDTFKDACDTALLALIYKAEEPETAEEAAKLCHMIFGARELTKSLLNLAETPEIAPRPANIRNLDHTK